MKKQLVAVLMVIFSMLGIFDASYITYEEFSGSVPMCMPPFDCGKVLDSPWASIFGVPLSVYGLVFYSTVFVLAVMNLLEVKVKLPVVKTITRGLRWLGVFGFLFSIYLVTLMQFIIQAWCLWCLVSAITTTSLFIISRFLPKEELAKESSD